MREEEKLARDAYLVLHDMAESGCPCKECRRTFSELEAAVRRGVRESGAPPAEAATLPGSSFWRSWGTFPAAARAMG